MRSMQSAHLMIIKAVLLWQPILLNLCAHKSHSCIDSVIQSMKHISKDHACVYLDMSVRASVHIPPNWVAEVSSPCYNPDAHT